MTAAIFDTSVHFNCPQSTYSEFSKYTRLSFTQKSSRNGIIPVGTCAAVAELISARGGQQPKRRGGRERKKERENERVIRYVPALAELYKPACFPSMPRGKMGKGSVDHRQFINRLEILEHLLWINSLSRIGKSPENKVRAKSKPFFAEFRSITSRPFPAPSR